jgi:hypothetical protein
MAKDVYKMTSSELEKHWDSLGILCTNTMIWPDPRDLLMFGSKLYSHHIISISASFLGHSIPNSVVCDNPTITLIEDILNGNIDGVLKREYSRDELHVYTKNTKNAAKKFKAAISDEKKMWNCPGSKVFPQ